VAKKWGGVLFILIYAYFIYLNARFIDKK